MKKIDGAVLQQTRYILLVTVILSLLTQAVFLIAGRWDITVLLGNLLSGTAAVLNFLFMGITVQKAVLMEEKEAKKAMKASQSLRMVFLFAVAALGAGLDCFHIVTVLVPLFFPRIAVAIWQFREKKRQ